MSLITLYLNMPANLHEVSASATGESPPHLAATGDQRLIASSHEAARGGTVFTVSHETLERVNMPGALHVGAFFRDE